MARRQGGKPKWWRRLHAPWGTGHRSDSSALCMSGANGQADAVASWGFMFVWGEVDRSNAAIEEVRVCHLGQPISLDRVSLHQEAGKAGLERNLLSVVLACFVRAHEQW
eukprot:2950395-Amphidinium_carterae.1